MQLTYPQTYNLPQSLLRTATLCICGLTMTFGLFVLMAKLIEQEDLRIVKTENFSIGPVIYIEEPEDTRTKTPVKLRPQPLPVPPSMPTPEVETEATIATGWKNTGFEQAPIEISTNLGNGITDQTARPVVQIQPSYPADAARNGIEGWVSLAFTIDPAGNVSDIKIIDAEPKRTFDRSAKQALARWKYQPKLEDGKPVPQFGMKVMLTFNLEQ